jgi:hypothetical protein
VVSGSRVGVADRVRRVAREAALDAVTASRTIGSEEGGPTLNLARRRDERSLISGPLVSGPACGNTFTAETGASLAERMSRMGHSSTRAARLYLHTRQERDKEIAVTLDRMAKRELKRARKRRGG